MKKATPEDIFVDLKILLLILVSPPRIVNSIAVENKVGGVGAVFRIVSDVTVNSACIIVKYLKWSCNER